MTMKLTRSTAKPAGMTVKLAGSIAKLAGTAVKLEHNWKGIHGGKSANKS
jgi:hypothetical protein